MGRVRDVERRGKGKVIQEGSRRIRFGRSSFVLWGSIALWIDRRSLRGE